MRVISFMVCDGGRLKVGSDAFNTKLMVCLLGVHCQLSKKMCIS